MLLQEERCPVSESLFGEMYRASPDGLRELMQTVPAKVRAILVIYCYRRSHLAAMALTIATTCTKEDLIDFGGDLGALIYEQARRPPKVEPATKRKVTLAEGPIFQFAFDQELA